MLRRVRVWLHMFTDDDDACACIALRNGTEVEWDVRLAGRTNKVMLTER